MDCISDGYEIYFINGLNIERYLCSHKFYEILFILSGELNLMSESGAYHSDKSVIALIPPNFCHCNMLCGGSSEYTRYVLYFSEDFISGIPDKDALLALFSQGEAIYELNPQSKKRLVSDFDRLYKDHTPINARILIQLILYDVSLLGSTVPLELTPYKNYIGGVVAYISENYRKKLVASELAAQFGVSRTKLMTDFRLATGYPIGNYIMRERVAHARKLLKDGYSVTRAAELSGFSSDTHFRYCFHIVMGMTPSDYRQNGEKIERFLR